jgi:hypothetical protein
MKLVTSLSVERPSHEPGPFWPRGVERLILVVLQPDRDRDTLVATGIESDGKRSRLVFEALLPRDRLSAFVAAVIDGNATVIHCHRGHLDTAARTVIDEHAAAVAEGLHVVTFTREADRTLRIVLALAVAIRSEELLTEAVNNEHRHRAHDKDC